jgi:hypothetical protein
VRIVVNHLTRMQPGYICVAGIDLDTGQHIRPVVGDRRMGAHLLRRNRGLFDIAAVFDLGRTLDHGHPPEVEDRLFEPRDAVHQRDMSPDEFWDLLTNSAAAGTTALFGDALQPRGRTYAVDVGRGRAFLGCLRPTQASLEIDRYGAVRASVTDGDLSASLPVTDIRLFEDDFKTPRREAINHLARRMRSGVDVLLCLGLAARGNAQTTPPRATGSRSTTSSSPTTRYGRTRTGDR